MHFCCGRIVFCQKRQILRLIFWKNAKRIRLLYQKKTFDLSSEEKNVLRWRNLGKNPFKIIQSSKCFQLRIKSSNNSTKNPSILPFWLFSSLVQWTFFCCKSSHAARTELSQIKLSKKCKSIDYQALAQCTTQCQFWKISFQFYIELFNIKISLKKFWCFTTN